MIASSVCVCTSTPGDCLCTLEGLNGGDDKIVEEELLTAIFQTIFDFIFI